MDKNFLTSIKDDIENMDLKPIYSNICKDEDRTYIQLSDKNGFLNDRRLYCHYEIIHWGKGDKYHKDNKIYVEIHVENKIFGKDFKYIIDELKNNNEELESFPWREYCCGLRIKNCFFEKEDTTEIINNLRKLKILTMKELLRAYLEIRDSAESKNWKPSFNFEKTSKKVSKERVLSKFTREPKEIMIIHEEIKESLIARINENPKLLGEEYEIDVNWVSQENKVNEKNYIDLVSKIKASKEFIFFEIKTTPDARLCIRQALGQLMEYSFFPDCDNAKLLVVVGTGDSTPNIKKYEKFLQKRFNINIRYLPIKI